MLKVGYLGDHQEYIGQVVDWICQEFASEKNWDFFEGIIKHSLVKGKLPITFIALIGDELVGTVGLWRSDLKSRQDLFPWLSALVVKKEHRNKKISYVLESFLVDYCREMNIEEIYLYTDLINYYEKMEWKPIGKGVDHTGEYYEIYKKVL